MALPGDIREIVRDMFGRLVDIPKYVAITFDDGFEVQYTNAKRLKEMGIPATFFITTNYMGKSGYMTWDQVKEIVNMGHEVGSHTISHPHLPTLSEEDIEREVGESKDIIEEKVGVTPESFAYPYGEYDFRVLYYVRKYYKQARSTDKYVYDITVPVRPPDRYRIGLPPKMFTFFANPYYTNVFRLLPFVPCVVLFHDEDFDEDILPVIKELMYAGAEFLTFSEFVDAVRKMGRLNVEIPVGFAPARITAETEDVFGIIPGKVYITIATDHPNNNWEIHTATSYYFRYDTSLKSNLTAEYMFVSGLTRTGRYDRCSPNLINSGNAPGWRVLKWDESTPDYVVETTEPIPTYDGLYIHYYLYSDTQLTRKYRLIIEL